LSRIPLDAEQFRLAEATPHSVVREIFSIDTPLSVYPKLADGPHLPVRSVEV
jgi:hypothetical protein